MSGEVSARLRETTPSLFSQNDALSNKASELVSMAASTPAKYEQLNMLRESVKVCCQLPMVLARGNRYTHSFSDTHFTHSTHTLAHHTILSSHCLHPTAVLPGHT